MPSRPGWQRRDRKVMTLNLSIGCLREAIAGPRWVAGEVFVVSTVLRAFAARANTPKLGNWWCDETSLGKSNVSEAIERVCRQAGCATGPQARRTILTPPGPALASAAIIRRVRSSNRGHTAEFLSQFGQRIHGAQA